MASLSPDQRDRCFTLGEITAKSFAEELGPELPPLIPLSLDGARGIAEDGGLSAEVLDEAAEEVLLAAVAVWAQLLEGE